MSFRPAEHASFGQPRLPKILNIQLRVCLAAPSDPPRYCKGGIDLKQTCRRLMRLSHFDLTFTIADHERRDCGSVWVAVKVLEHRSVAADGEPVIKIVIDDERPVMPDVTPRLKAINASRAGQGN